MEDDPPIITLDPEGDFSRQITLLTLGALVLLVALMILNMLVEQHPSLHTAEVSGSDIIAYSRLQRDLLATLILARPAAESVPDPEAIDLQMSRVTQDIEQVAAALSTVDLPPDLAEEWQHVMARWEAARPDLLAWRASPADAEKRTAVYRAVQEMLLAVNSSESSFARFYTSLESERSRSIIRLRLALGMVFSLFLVFLTLMLTSLYRFTRVQQRRRMQIEQSETRYRKLVNFAPTPIVVHQDGYIVYANPAAVALVAAADESDLLGKPALDFVHPDYRDLAAERIRRIMTMREPQPLAAEKFIRIDGKVIDVEVASVPVDFEGRPAIQVVILDVTRRLQAERAEREQRAIADALRNATTAISSTLELDEVLDRILESIETVVPHDAADIMLLEEDTARIVRSRGYDVPDIDRWFADGRFDVARTPVMARVIETRQPVLVTDTEAEPGWVRFEQTAWIRSHIAVPIVVQDEVIGFLHVNSREPGHFDEGHARSLQGFADEVAGAIQNAQLYRVERERRSQAELLQQAATAISATLELDEVLRRILRQLREVIPFDSASVQQLEGDQMVIVAAAGLDERVRGVCFPLEDRFPNAEVIRRRAPYAVPDVRASYPHFQVEADKYVSGNIRSWLGVPLLIRGQLIGMISIDRREVRPYTPEEIDLAMAFASQAAIAINNAQLYRELESYSESLRAAVEERTAQLRRITERVEAILDNSPDAILLLKPSGVVNVANPAFRRMFGYGPDESFGLYLSDLIAPDSARPMQQALHAALHSGGVRRLEVVARRRNGDTFNAEVALSVIHESEGISGIVCSLRDITTLKQAERIKDEFVSNVSHELRTPIASIKLYLKLLSSRPADQERYLDRLDRETRRLELIVEDLLYLSRMAQGQVGFTPRPVDVNELITGYITDRSVLAEQRGIDLQLKPGQGIPAVWADYNLLGRVFSIVLTNALNYTPQGGCVQVSTFSRRFGDRQCVGIRIKDNGPGISPQERARLFERFFRGRAALNSGVSGTGLGLAIAKEIMEWHRGAIRVYSRGIPGEGAVFAIWLPAALDQQPDTREV
ncbi:MAG: hypothetical protein Kow00124_18250 [Anaerolineae bacterium]